MNRMDIAGQVAVITGGSGGVGAATAIRMLNDGARVWAIDLNAGALADLSARYPGISTLRVDLLDEASVEGAVREILERDGRIDILVNSVGVEGVRSEVADHSLAEFRRIMDVNLTATFITCKYVVRVMKQAGYGRIVNLSSTSGKDGNAMGVAYSAAKAALINLTKSLGQELATTGVLVNCVTPAALESELFRRNPPDRQARALGKIPMGRLGSVDEIAAMVCWMSSPECSFSTGATFDASGGRSTY